MIPLDRQIDIVCIGTPNIKGDALGPLVGSMLKQHSFGLDVNIVGTLDSPITRSTFYDKYKELRRGAFVVAVDATVGNSVGEYEYLHGPIYPGAAFGYDLPSVGDISVKACTASTNDKLISADVWDVTLLAYRIVSELAALLKATKRVYI